MGTSALSEFEHAYYIGNYLSGILYGVALVIIDPAPNNRHIVQRRLGRTNVDYIPQRSGGVPGFIVAQTLVWYETLGLASGVAIIFMGDTLLLYRLFIIYGSKYIVILLPSIAYLAAFSLAIIELVLAGHSTLNMIVTLLICLRLFQHKKTLGGALGREQAKMYRGVVSMLIESAAPCSLLGIMFLVPYTRGVGVTIAFGQVWMKLTVNYPPIDE
ncbi:hypothetical protein K443DRAFT_121859 [Laccaria amethystina LaAM-08-1]|uniref:Uncharacterized protein n=1 Tax=Laccaria amethystina LaAM-08-1 TaxID=1095629 RepID=A0A0C9XLU3_9AGAR|nr:hypothetical protein K443DRAFT_125382 [Laccaria amethystina LaAM-08-1]KIK02514.1 hypothetical protein K443DRAFT_121859 [Laccaria amethystina LaAM-08-1]